MQYHGVMRPPSFLIKLAKQASINLIKAMRVNGVTFVLESVFGCLVHMFLQTSKDSIEILNLKEQIAHNNLFAFLKIRYYILKTIF